MWNTTDVTLDETSITGEHMSDIYVKGYAHVNAWTFICFDLIDQKSH